MNVFVLGGGTLGRFIADVAADRADIIVAGFFDDRFPSVDAIDGIPVVGRFADAQADRHHHLIIGVGEPKTRQQLFEQYQRAGFAFPSVVHPSAAISRHARIGDGVIIGPHCTVLSGSQIGTGGCLLSHVNINHDTIAHPWCLIGAGATIGNGVVLEEGCHIAMGAVITPAAVVAAWSYAG